MKNEIAITRALEMLKKSGKKQTKNREEMIRYLALENRYLSAKEVYSFLVQDNPGVSFDTIYRNLKDFSEIGILEETELNAEKNFRFHCVIPGSDHHHHHFICTPCGATKELNLCPMDYFQNQLPNCLIESHRFEIFGQCETCLAKKTEDSVEKR